MTECPVSPPDYSTAAPDLVSAATGAATPSPLPMPLA